jgi:phosphoglycerate dehydrogenase-like enzyme
MLKIYRGTQTLEGYLPHLTYTESKEDAEIIIVGGKKFDLKEFPKLRGIFKTGVGTDNLPFEEAKIRNIYIQLPSESTKAVIYDETASFTCHLILMALYQHSGNFDTWSKTNRGSLTQKHLLVMGTGNIGRRVVSRMKNFMIVDTFDPQQNNPEILNPLIKKADCISIQMPLDDSTKNFFNAARLSLMKDGGVLINTSRGPIVNENALFDQLNSGRIRAAFDVFWEEPYKGKLLKLPEDRFIRTPHVASTCKEFLEGLAQDFLAFSNEIEQNQIA